ncbi:hypothetical protein WK41_32335 [Burkholderia cepacia]|nr:hypothetical protein WK41_32335 [Burkholderia cepacia]
MDARLDLFLIFLIVPTIRIRLRYIDVGNVMQLITADRFYQREEKFALLLGRKSGRQFNINKLQLLPAFFTCCFRQCINPFPDVVVVRAVNDEIAILTLHRYHGHPINHLTELTFIKLQLLILHFNIKTITFRRINLHHRTVSFKISL